MEELEEVISPDEIAGAVGRLAGAISRDYAGKNLLAVCVLKGAFIFFSDLIRELTVPVEVDFLKVSSYGPRTVSSGEVKIDCRMEADVKDRDVLVVEDIVDTGRTLDCIIKKIRTGKPRSVKICALLDKPARREIKIAPDYTGFVMDDHFLVGYGLDLGGRHRNLRGVYKVRPPCRTVRNCRKTQ